MKTSSTCKVLSKTLILGSTNPKYDKRLFIDLSVQYMKTTSSDLITARNKIITALRVECEKSPLVNS